VTDQQAIEALTQELARINRNLELIFGVPEVDTTSGLALQVQALINEHKAALKGITVWPATDSTGQTYLCVRHGFMQPVTSFPVDDLDAAKAYLSGVVRSRANR